MLQVGAGGYAHIDQAVAAPLEGDTILIALGNHLETIRVHGKSIDIRGIGDRRRWWWAGLTVAAPNSLTPRRRWRT